jgi:hypothetical protein
MVNNPLKPENTIPLASFRRGFPTDWKDLVLDVVDPSFSIDRSKFLSNEIDNSTKAKTLKHGTHLPEL